jgi:hypothetical protein
MFKIILITTIINLGQAVPSTFDRSYASVESCQVALAAKIQYADYLFNGSQTKVIGYCKEVSNDS